MSTAAHEPRRAGPRRANSSSGSQVAPRRNAPEAGEPNGIQYDSDEVPVLIRLPNLRDTGSAEPQPNSSTRKRRHRAGRPSAGKQRTSKQDASKVSKKSFRQQAGSNKLVLGGVVGGVLVVVALFLINAGGPKLPAEQDGWANKGAEPESVAQEPQNSIPTENDPPSLYPGFAYEAPNTETAQYASGELKQVPISAPLFDKPVTPRQTENLAMPSHQQSVTGWPSDGMIEPRSGTESTSSDLWPNENLSFEQRGYQIPSTEPPSQTDYRSSMNSTEPESYRTGMLDPDRPQAMQDDRGSSILDGVIETPDTTSLR